jgi:hypothetical protein
LQSWLSVPAVTPLADKKFRRFKKFATNQPICFEKDEEFNWTRKLNLLVWIDGRYFEDWVGLADHGCVALGGFMGWEEEGFGGMPDKVQDADGLEVDEVGNLLVLLHAGIGVWCLEGAVVQANADQEGAQVLGAACPQHLIASIFHQRELPCIVHHAH